MTIKIDLDGVIRDILTPMCKIYNEIVSPDVPLAPSDITEYDVNKSMGLISRTSPYVGWDVGEVLFTGSNAERVFIGKARPIKGAREAVERLKDAGHKVIVSTWQRDTANKIYTLRWLELYRIPYDDLFFSRDKHLLRCDYLIDDNPEFLLSEEEDARKIRIEYPYNEYIDGLMMHTKSLSEAVDIILKETK